MRWFGPAYAKTVTDDGRQMTVVLRRECRGVDLLLAGGCVSGAALCAGYGSWLGAGFCLLFAVMFLWDALSEKQLVIAADPDGIFAERTFYRWNQIYRLEYDGGGENESSSLRLRQLTKDAQILKGIGQEQAEEIIALLRRRFPDAPMAADPGPRTAIGRWFKRVMG
ncbi:hypothetical protein SAMN05421819_2925 [Bryocella elongata]|uniref:Uncharacterized protein n=1 Tax=Bryocella elongata TaxID=863522 RepID=A0A1H6A5L1_9BACT|nr:hypothetical protein [Bryocella elongata]SEG43630.1 hypothetical protein SAMN05421819_2925 [Bryocella elongata]